MTEPTLALQQAIMATLAAAAPGATVYDNVPRVAPTPYIQIGDDQVVPNAAECFERSVEVYVTIHVYSTAVGKPETKRIAGAVVDALDNAALNLGAGLSLDSILHHGSRFITEPDGLTSHGILTFRALIDPA